MRRIPILAAATAAAVVPAVIGLSGNPALSHSVPVRVPGNTTPVTVADFRSASDDSAASRRPDDSRLRPATPTATHVRHAGEPGEHAATVVRTAEPGEHAAGDVRHAGEPGEHAAGVVRTAEPGEHAAGVVRTAEPGEHAAGAVRTGEPGEHAAGVVRTAEPGEHAAGTDRGGSGGRGGR